MPMQGLGGIVFLPNSCSLRLLNDCSKMLEAILMGFACLLDSTFHFTPAEEPVGLFALEPTLAELLETKRSGFNLSRSTIETDD